MQKKVEERRKELENKTEGAGGGSGVTGGVTEHKPPVSSRQSSATNTPRNIRYTYYTTNVGALACVKSTSNTLIE